MPVVYNYNKAGWFIGSNQAFSDPLENPKKDPKGKWLLPANATFVEPPTASAGQLARWVNGQWELQADPSIETPLQKTNKEKQSKIAAINAQAAADIASTYQQALGSSSYDAGTMSLKMQQLMYVAQNVSGTQTAADIDAAKKQLASYNAAILKVQAIKEKMALDIAALGEA